MPVRRRFRLVDLRYRFQHEQSAANRQTYSEAEDASISNELGLWADAEPPQRFRNRVKIEEEKSYFGGRKASFTFSTSAQIFSEVSLVTSKYHCFRTSFLERECCQGRFNTS